MDLTLRSVSFTSQGVFSNVFDQQSNIVLVSLEHAYSDGNGGWVPKLCRGQVYTCERGIHELKGKNGGLVPIETFMFLGVPDFQGKPVTGVLWHPGNFDIDSEGCVLTGTAMAAAMITQSVIAFKKFMALQSGLSRFQVTVK